MNKIDCFAYDEIKNICRGLNDLYCEKEGKCAFFRTKEEKQKRDEELLKRKLEK